MCSIIGYMGKLDAAPLLVESLGRMEYRGYDSVGIATINGDHRILVRKGVGRVAEVNNKLGLEVLRGTVGVGHTRWATHGGVTSANAHPHMSTSNEIAIVHNGIIDNYLELKNDLIGKGFVFRSETDSEVIANLLQEGFDQTRDIKKSIMYAVSKLKGTYAFIAMFGDGTLAAARFHQPILIGIDKEGYFISSDVIGFVEHTDDVIYVNDREFAIIKSSDIKLFDFDGALVQHQIVKVSKEFAGVKKGEYAHFTLKEIAEQPIKILRMKENMPSLDLATRIIKEGKNVYITGSGTSYNASLVGQYLFSKYAKIKVEPIMASEMRFYPHYFDNESILIALSQSGETADVLESVNIARSAGTRVISIVNVMTSSLVQNSDVSIGLNCGPEIGVAATKSFTSQLAILYKIADKLCEGRIQPNLNEVAENIFALLCDHRDVQDIARKLRGVSDIYVLGRGIHYPIASEAALKIKELAYIHAEGLHGGELKHGPLALMDHDVYVIIINPSDSTYVDTLASAHEIKARGAKIIGISDVPNDVYDHWIQIPTINDILFPLIEIIPIQLLAYYTALERHTDPDYPRNLAKCVTVK
jgi:glucosamine--fructose-6-phosphate aminotransferase (isomerizing)